ATAVIVRTFRLPRCPSCVLSPRLLARLICPRHTSSTPDRLISMPTATARTVLRSSIGSGNATNTSLRKLCHHVIRPSIDCHFPQRCPHDHPQQAREAECRQSETRR